MKTYLKDLTPDEVIRRLKAGEVVKHEKGNYEKKWIDGIICTISMLVVLSSTIA